MSYQCVADGIYRDSRTGNLYERPTVHGRRTFRKLQARSIKIAKEEMAAKRTLQGRAAVGLAEDPYTRKPIVDMRTIISAWLGAGCPKRNGEHRGVIPYNTKKEVEKLSAWWGPKTPAEVSPATCQAYASHRRRQMRRATDGGRSVDMELSTLSTALHFAVLQGLTPYNPLAGSRPRFYQASKARHCREFAPASGDELHALATAMFESAKSEVLGWQLLVQAMTGTRTSEVLRLRWDAKAKEPGFIEGEWLWLRRSKGGVNPFAVVHPALRKCMAALAAWRKRRFPSSPWYFPSPDDPTRHVDKSALAHALLRVGPVVCQAKRTAHGLRAFFVTVRRSAGISDAQVAAEIGDRTGAAIIASTYGAIPPNWRGGAELDFMPAKGKPAWNTLSHTSSSPARAVS
jgi:integrase